MASRGFPWGHRYNPSMSEHTERLRDLAERIAAAKEFL
jgi:hypothetical protein